MMTPTLASVRRGRTSSRTTVSLAVALLLWGTCPQLVSAWGNKIGHRRIVKRAIELIERDHPDEYNQLSYHSPVIQRGADEEDNPLWNVKDHFHNPWSTLENQGLSTFIEVPGREPEQYDQAGYFHESAVYKSVRLFENAGTLYRLPGTDNREFAYDKLGHVAHLATADLFQPQHVHDDAHLIWTAGDSSLERRYDQVAETIVLQPRWSIRHYQAPPLSSTKLAAIATHASVFTSTNSRFSGILTGRENPLPDGTNGHIAVTGLGLDGLPRPVFFEGREDAENPNERAAHYRIQGS